MGRHLFFKSLAFVCFCGLILGLNSPFYVNAADRKIAVSSDHSACPAVLLKNQEYFPIVCVSCVSLQYCSCVSLKD